MTTERGEFFSTLGRALERGVGQAHEPEPIRFDDEATVAMRADAVRHEADARGGELLDQLYASAEAGGWVVHRPANAEEALGVVVDIAVGLGAKSLVRSDHDVLGELGVDGPLSEQGIVVTKMASAASSDDGESAPMEAAAESMRDAAVGADLGLTGSDYAVAETGSVVLVAGRGVSRIVSLVPPVHVAVVRKGSVLPGLDELFTMLRRDHGAGDPASYVNVISGPSRSADIEYTLVTGVHGPGEVHLILLD